MKFETLKCLVFISFIPIFAACNNSAEKTADATHADSVSEASALAPETVRPNISAADTLTKIDSLKKLETGSKAVTISPGTEDPSAQKSFKTIRGAKSRPVIAAPEKKVENPNIKKGAMLISNSDCFACHQIAETLVGPAYKDVAKKYETNSKNIEYLAAKIINGGTGVWGEIYMAPHPSVSQEDARAMVEYILSLK